MDDVVKAARAARDAAESLREHPNSKTHVKARTMALVTLVKAVEDTFRKEGRPVTGAQTFAAELLGCDRQLINRHMRRAADRGWVETGWRKPRQTEFSEVVEMEHHPAGKPPILPPFSLPEPYAY